MLLNGRSTLIKSECPPPGLSPDGSPVQAYLELTPACNCRCPGCLNESFIGDFTRRALRPAFHRPPLSTDGWRAILSLLPGTIHSIILSGGEPSLHPGFGQICVELNSRGFAFVIFSNGRWTAPDEVIALLKKLPSFQGFLISLHGASSACHEEFVGIAGAFEETVSNIHRAVQAQLPVTMSTVITRKNWAEIEETVALAIELGVEEITFNRYLFTPERLTLAGQAIQPPTPAQLQTTVRKIEALRSQLAGRIRIGYGPSIPQCFERSSSQGCSAGEAAFVVDPWGNLKPCLHSDLLAGNLLEQEFGRIWENSAMQAWRNLASSPCTSCSAFSQCGSGCRAMAMAWKEGKDPLMRVPILQAASRVEEKLVARIA